MKNKKSFKKPTPQDIKRFKLIKAVLSKSEFETLRRFYNDNKDLPSDEKNALLQEKYPYLYDKLIKIGGNIDGK